MSLLIPAIVLAFISFAFSAFVILRIVIPILPPSPLSRRVSPAEFGLPNFRSLSPADKSHLWLASFDIIALILFVWQVAVEYGSGPSGFAVAADPASAARIWLALTMRQSCLLTVAAVTLVHVRLGQSVTFGARHWMLWAPTLVLVAASTAIAAVFATTGFTSFFVGLVAYSSTIAVLSSVAFACLVGTLIIIKRNLASLNEASDPWPPMTQTEEKPRPSFATEDVDVLRDGASWITSNASSRRDSISNWSFSTHHTKRSGTLHQAKSSIPAKSSFWFNPSSTQDLHAVPPVPALPSPYTPTSPTGEALSDPDPFRRATPSDASPIDSHHPRDRLGSQTSWLTSTSGTRPTLSAWSFPGPAQSQASLPDLNANLLPVSRPVTPALSSAKVLGGYGYNPQTEVEQGLAALATPGTDIDISISRAIGWFVMIWVPLAFSLPYLFTVSSGKDSAAMYVLLALSVTSSSPILAFNILCRSPIPIPAGLFDIRSPPVAPSTERLPYSSSDTRFTHEYKRSASCSVTVVEGRRSGDVWLSNGNAMESKTKLGRAMSMLAPMPKLSVLPSEESAHMGDLTPPLPMQMPNDENDMSGIKVSKNSSPTSEISQTSAEIGRLRKESKASSHYSGGDESLAYASRIMIAQRHYSALAQTMHVAASPDRQSIGNLLVATATGTETPKMSARLSSSHMRCRSVTSTLSVPSTPTISSNPSPSPPPSFPIPPTPPNVRAARLASLKHKKSFSSGEEFSFGVVDDINEIDALTAGVLPILVPGLKVGKEMKIKSGEYSAPTSMNGRSKKLPRLNEFGLPDNTPPAAQSTPARRRNRKDSRHARNHMSLPSLGLGKDGAHYWTADIKTALDTKLGQCAMSPDNVNRRNTVWGGVESLAGMDVNQMKSSTGPTKLGRKMSTRVLGLSPEVPHEVEHVMRTSVATTLVNPPASATSSVTLFDDFEAGLLEGPVAQSTPHESKTAKPSKAKLRPSKQRPPPLPLETDQRNSRRSSIVYIKSNEPVSSATLLAESADSSPGMFSRWPSRFISSAGSSKPKTKGLRPLSILQERDANSSSDNSSKNIRPLTVSKKGRKSKGSDENENTPPDAAKTKGLKPLSLVRTETAKLRGKLRNNETLPEVVIRPPSNTVNISPYGYTFD